MSIVNNFIWGERREGQKSDLRVKCIGTTYLTQVSLRSKFSPSSFIHCAAVKLSTREDLERRGYTEKEAFAPLLHVEVISGSLLMSDDCLN